MRTVRRVVTGHNADGQAVIVQDGLTQHGVKLDAVHVEFFEVWNTGALPAAITAVEPDPTDRSVAISPPRGGSIIRMVDFHPGSREAASVDPADVFGQIGSTHASTWTPTGRHKLMHRTETIDYGLVMEGEIHLIVDDGETLLRTGDVVVQRGTNHAWENRGDVTCRMAFILLDGAYDPGIADPPAPNPTA